MNTIPIMQTFSERQWRLCWTICLCCCMHTAQAIEAYDYADSRTVRANGQSFVLNAVGKQTQPVVLLLHGFPDSRHVWRYQIPALLNAGFRVVAPDLRGYGESSRPAGVEHYAIELLAQDVIGILDALQISRAHVVGHDFGAGLAWYTVAVHPEKFASLVALSVGVAGNAGWHTIEQREASWYFDFFNKAGIAETALQANDFRLFRALIRNQGDPERFFTDLSRPGALTAALNWYRANLQNWGAVSEPPVYPMIQIPVMGVWSDGDHHLKEAQMKHSRVNISGAWRYERVTGAGHWMMLEKPELINRLLLDFLTTLQTDE